MLTRKSSSTSRKSKRNLLSLSGGRRLPSSQESPSPSTSPSPSPSPSPSSSPPRSPSSFFSSGPSPEIIAKSSEITRSHPQPPQTNSLFSSSSQSFQTSTSFQEDLLSGANFNGRQQILRNKNSYSHHSSFVCKTKRSPSLAGRKVSPVQLASSYANPFVSDPSKGERKDTPSVQSSYSNPFLSSEESEGESLRGGGAVGGPVDAEGNEEGEDGYSNPFFVVANTESKRKTVVKKKKEGKETPKRGELEFEKEKEREKREREREKREGGYTNPFEGGERRESSFSSSFSSRPPRSLSKASIRTKSRGKKRVKSTMADGNDECTKLLSESADDFISDIRRKLIHYLEFIDKDGLFLSMKEIGLSFQSHIQPLLAGSSMKRRILKSSMFKFMYDLPILLSNSTLPLQKQQCEDEEKLYESLSQEWCEIAKKCWERNRWPEVFHLIGRFLDSTFLEPEVNLLRELFSSFATSLSKREKIIQGKHLMENMAYDAIEYLSFHKMDPCNFFIGASPSSFMEGTLVSIEQLLENEKSVYSEKLHKNEAIEPTFSSEKTFNEYLDRWISLSAHPNRIISEMDQLRKNWIVRGSHHDLSGQIVAVRLDGLLEDYRRWFPTNEENVSMVFCRVASCSPSSRIVEVFFDGFERMKIPISFDFVSCLPFGKKKASKVLFSTQRTNKGALFYDPLEDFFPMCVEYFEKEILNFLEQKGVRESGDLRTPPLSQIGKIGKEVCIMKKLLEEQEFLDAFFFEFLERMKSVFSMWTTNLSEGLIGPRIFDAFEEIRSFITSLRQLVDKEFLHHFKTKSQQLYHLKKRVLGLVSGERKNEVCAWWLNHIEKRVADYLEECGYVADAMADDYMREAPKDLEQVKKNHSIVKEQFEMENDVVLGKFVKETTAEVYEKLNVLIEEFEFISSVAESFLVEFDCSFAKEQRESLLSDLQYLQRVKAMDEEIKRKRQEGDLDGKRSEMTDVVPVSGLVMARFHILETECHTTLEIWGKKKKKEIIDQLTSRTPPEGTWLSHFVHQPLAESGTNSLQTDSDVMFGFFKAVGTDTQQEFSGSDEEEEEEEGNFFDEERVRARDLVFTYQGGMEEEEDGDQSKKEDEEYPYYINLNDLKSDPNTSDKSEFSPTFLSIGSPPSPAIAESDSSSSSSPWLGNRGIERKKPKKKKRATTTGQI